MARAAGGAPVRRSGRGRFRTNSLGLRSDEPFADARRIVYVLGGSTVADIYLDQEETWVYLVQQGLKTWCTHQRYFSPRALVEGMRAFNDVLRDVCRAPGMACRDLAAALPPRAEYFYDDMHLSEAGARRVVELVVAWILELPATLRPRP